MKTKFRFILTNFANVSRLGAEKKEQLSFKIIDVAHVSLVLVE